MIPLNAVGEGLGYMLAMRDRYAIAAAAPIVNALFGSALLVLWPEGGLLNLALGTVIGLALQVTICLVGLARTKFYLFGSLPARDELRQEWREMARLSAWIFPGVIFANMTATLPITLIAAYGEGAVSAFGYAWRFHQFAIHLLVMAVSPVLLSHISNLVAIGDEDRLRRLLGKGLWFSLITGVSVAVVVGFFGQSILSVIFQGRFDDIAASRVSGYWLWLSIALAPALLGNIYAKVWQARGMAGLMSLLAGFGLIMFFITIQLFSSVLESHSIPAAVGASSLAVTIAGWTLAWRPAQK
jgi:peptidoglycan biosynthesis protein MviN/MurJ (putative lipid II flippase)